ncbi:hypothetical protein [Flavobacterium sp.]|jgi:hypothetical protein|uniref:hypothetical protein n=1 Tax=Flavobacterium sp. TaxID=239 RepID=UPI0037BEE79F
MKKKIEGELISIAHRLLKLKNHTETIQLLEEVKKLYEQLALLKFYEANTALVNEEFSEELFEEKVEKIIVGTIDVVDEEEIYVEMASKEHIAQIEEELFEKNEISHELFPSSDIVEIEKEEILSESIEEETPEEELLEEELLEEKSVQEEAPEQVIETQIKKKKTTSNPEIIGTKVTKQISMEDILVHDYQDTFFEKKEATNEPTSDSSEAVTEEEIIEEISIEVESVSESTPEVEIEIVSETKEEIPVVNGKAIVLGLNDKIAFEKNLFAGNGDDLNRVLSQLNTFTNWEEAKSFVLDFVKPDYNNWENKEEFEVRFLEIVENKFN